MLETIDNMTIDDLIVEYHRSCEQIAKSEQEHAEIKEHLNSLILSDAPKKERIAARTVLLELTEQIDALCELKKRIRSHLVQAIPIDAQERIDSVHQDLSALREKEQEPREKFIELVAKAIVLRESYKGRTIKIGRRGAAEPDRFPSLEFKPHNELKGEELSRFADMVEIFRQELAESGPTIAERRAELEDELRRLEKVIQSDPDEFVTQLLGEKEKPADPADQEPRHHATVRPLKPKPVPEYRERPIGEKAIFKPAQMYPEGPPKAQGGKAQ